MKYELNNECLTVKIESVGAEMVSLLNNKTGQEYLWNADEKFWKRSSPVLFPCVGSMKNKQYEYNDKIYEMPQHGFARDLEFDCIFENAEEIWFQLNATPNTKKCYPFDFSLEIGYRLVKNEVTVMWKVKNKDKVDMYFSIGAHPAFNCPLKEGELQSDYSIWMDAKNDAVLYSLPDQETGLMMNYKNELHLPKGRRLLTEGFFDEGAYIIEDYQVKKMSLVDPENKPYISVLFDAPVVGLWSPEQKKAPFVCIEPWYGRCDRETFDGTLKTREWSNKLHPDQIFEKSYRILVEQFE